eukprot:3381332-Pyramimonas_sp.AAC.1
MGRARDCCAARSEDSTWPGALRLCPSLRTRRPDGLRFGPRRGAASALVPGRHWQSGSSA